MHCRYTQEGLQEKLQVQIKGAQIEDASELPSSPLHYLLCCTAKDRQCKTTAADFKCSNFKSMLGSSEKHSASLSLLLSQLKGTSQTELQVTLCGLALHLMPSYIRELQEFFLEVLAPASSSSGKETESSSSQSLSSVGNEFNSLLAAHSQHSQGGLHGQNNIVPCLVSSGFQMNSTEQNSKRLHTTSPGSVSNLGKAWGPQKTNATTAPEFEVDRGGQQIHSSFASLPAELQPESVMFERQSESGALNLHVQLEGCAVQFFDSGNIVAGVVIPEASAYTSNIASPHEHWEVKVAATDVQVKGTGLASGNVDKDAVGSVNHGPPATWNISIKNGCDGSSFEIILHVQHAQILLLSNYLASLAGYFNISNWKPYRKPDIINWSQSSVCLKLEVENSLLFVPAEQSKDEYLQLGLGKLVLSTVQKGGTTDIFDIQVQGVSVWVQSTAYKVKHAMDGEMGEVSDEGIALVQRWDGVLSIEVPTGDFPTCLEICSSVVEFNVNGNASFVVLRCLLLLILPREVED